MFPEVKITSQVNTLMEYSEWKDCTDLSLLFNHYVKHEGLSSLREVHEKYATKEEKERFSRTLCLQTEGITSEEALGFEENIKRKKKKYESGEMGLRDSEKSGLYQKIITDTNLVEKGGIVWASLSCEELKMKLSAELNSNKLSINCITTYPLKQGLYPEEIQLAMIEKIFIHHPYFLEGFQKGKIKKLVVMRDLVINNESNYTYKLSFMDQGNDDLRNARMFTPNSLNTYNLVQQLEKKYYFKTTSRSPPKIVFNDPNEHRSDIRYKHSFEVAYPVDKIFNEYVESEVREYAEQSQETSIIEEYLNALLFKITSCNLALIYLPENLSKIVVDSIAELTAAKNILRSGEDITKWDDKLEKAVGYYSAGRLEDNRRKASRLYDSAKERAVPLFAAKDDQDYLNAKTKFKFKFFSPNDLANHLILTANKPNCKLPFWTTGHTTWEQIKALEAHVTEQRGSGKIIPLRKQVKDWVNTKTGNVSDLQDKVRSYVINLCNAATVTHSRPVSVNFPIVRTNDSVQATTTKPM